MIDQHRNGHCPTVTAAEISVVVVNYGTADLAIAAVDSVLERKHGGRVVDVHLVDNASPNGDAARLAAAHADRGWGERVTLYLETENHGFGRGNNLVFDALAQRPTPPSYVMLLNPDAKLENEALAILSDCLDSQPRAAAAGAGISFPDGTPVTAAFRFPSAIWEFASAVNFGPITRCFEAYRVPLPPDHPAATVDWVSGAAVMFRFSTLLKIGGFDPTYFLYFEEVDLMRRLVNENWVVWYIPTAKVLHVEGAATQVRSGRKERRRTPKYWYDSWMNFYFKTYGRKGAILAATCWIFGVALNFPIAYTRNQKLSAPKYFIKDFMAFVVKPLILGKMTPSQKMKLEKTEDKNKFLGR